jgi:hypothetical protein
MEKVLPIVPPAELPSLIIFFHLALAISTIFPAIFTPFPLPNPAVIYSHPNHPRTIVCLARSNLHPFPRYFVPLL